MSDPTPLVTVVIPTYNYGAYVGQAIESALAQTYPAVEVVVVDDGSTDDTPARLAAYGDRIRVVRQANQGLSAARNAGIAAAAGEFIALLDSDDAFHPRKLELQLRHLARNPAVGLAGTHHFSDPARMWPAVEADPAVRPVALDELVLRSPFSPSSAVFRASCAAAVGGFDAGLRSVEDRDFWIRVGAKSPVAVVAAELTYYRVTPGSMSRNPERMENFERVVLDKAFAMPELAGRWAFRRKARGLASYASAYVFFAAGRPVGGFRRAVASFAWWPLPYAAADVRVRFGRLRLLAACAAKAVTRRGAGR